MHSHTFKNIQIVFTIHDSNILFIYLLTYLLTIYKRLYPWSSYALRVTSRYPGACTTGPRRVITHETKTQTCIYKYNLTPQTLPHCVKLLLYANACFVTRLWINTVLICHDRNFIEANAANASYRNWLFFQVGVSGEGGGGGGGGERGLRRINVFASFKKESSYGHACAPQGVGLNDRQVKGTYLLPNHAWYICRLQTSYKDTGATIIMLCLYMIILDTGLLLDQFKVD